jgi:hypothetical protein
MNLLAGGFHTTYRPFTHDRRTVLATQKQSSCTVVTVVSARAMADITAPAAKSGNASDTYKGRKRNPNSSIYGTFQ